MTARRDHAFRERQSLALNSAVAARLEIAPQKVISRAKSTISRWKAIPGVWCKDLADWEVIIDRGDQDEIFKILTGSSQRCIQLRQSSPFSVQLSPKERVRIIHETTSA